MAALVGLLERPEMPSERPYPGQLWKHDSTHVIVVAVHLNTITYEFLSGGQSVTQNLDVFLAVFTKVQHGSCRDSHKLGPERILPFQREERTIKARDQTSRPKPIAIEVASAHLPREPRNTAPTT